MDSKGKGKSDSKGKNPDNETNEKAKTEESPRPGPSQPLIKIDIQYRKNDEDPDDETNVQKADKGNRGSGPAPQAGSVNSSFISENYSLSSSIKKLNRNKGSKRSVTLGGEEIIQETPAIDQSPSKFIIPSNMTLLSEPLESNYAHPLFQQQIQTQRFKSMAKDREAGSCLSEYTFEDLAGLCCVFCVCCVIPPLVFLFIYFHYVAGII